MEYHINYNDLKNPDVFDDATAQNIEIVETHISVVFLTGEFAYKIKKPVNFGFLDFSTLEKRKHFCEEELRLNRKFSPDIYISIVPVRKKGKIIRISEKADGKLIDWAVKMKQLPRDRIMKELLPERVYKSDIERIVDILYNYYQKADQSPVINQFGKLDVVRKNWEENFEQTTKYINNTIEKKDFDYIKKIIINFMNDYEKLFEKRIEEGKIKECHGDLHSNQIFLLPNKVYITDCIEFNERFRFSDILADIAFLAMDLDFHNRQDLSKYLIVCFSRGEEIPSELLEFYKCYRAFVRGKVTSFLLDQKTEEAERIAIVARHYFSLSKNYAKKLESIVNIT